MSPETFHISLSSEEIESLKKLQEENSSEVVGKILDKVQRIMDTRDKDFYDLRHGGYGYGY